MSNIIVICIFSSILCQTWAKLSPLIEYKLSNWSGIVPEAVPEIPNDLEVCRVIYPSGAEVNLGNYLSESDLYEAPSSVTWTADRSSYYYLIFEDIDAPTRVMPTMRAMLHWMVGNIPGNDVAAGETVIKYRRPQGSRSSGLHRYVFLVYKQPEKIDFTVFKTKTNTSRGPFNAPELARRFLSQGPVAVNFLHYRVYPTNSLRIFQF